MLKALIVIRLRGMLSSLYKGSKKQKRNGLGMKVLFGLLGAYIIGAFGLLFGGLFYALYEPTHGALMSVDLAPLYWALAGFLGLTLGFVGSVFATQSQLYDARDNELLLAMPVRPWMILLSRMIVLYLLNALLNALVMVPAGVVCVMKGGATGLNMTACALGLLLVPLGALTLSALLGWALAWIGSHMRNKNIISLIASLGFLALYMVVMVQSESLIPLLLAHFDRVAAFIRTIGWPVWQLGRGACGQAGALGLFAACMVGPFAALVYVLGRSFVGIATRQKGASRVEYKKRAMKVSGVRAALLKKELKHFASSVGWMMNGGLGLVFLLVLPVMLMVKRESLAPLLALAEPYVAGGELLLGAALLLNLVMTMAPISSASVSLEAKTLWLMRSLPVRAGDILMAKALLQMTVAAPFVIVAFALCAAALPAGAGDMLLALLLMLSFMALMSLLGVALNVRFPKFDWTSETVAVKQGMSVAFTMLAGMALVIAPVGLYVWLGWGTLSPRAFSLILAALYTALAAALARGLTQGVARRFERL